jgi:hypothetical protein
MRIKFVIGLSVALVMGAATLVAVPLAGAQTQTTGTWGWCSAQSGWCFYNGPAKVRYVDHGTYHYASLPGNTGGTACNEFVFGLAYQDPTISKDNWCEVETPASITVDMGMTSDEYSRVISFDSNGTHGVPYSNPTGVSVGPPCAAPTSGAWAATSQYTSFGEEIRSMENISGWDQVYNVCNGANSRQVISNARIELSKMSVYVFFWSQNKWVEMDNTAIGGAAYPEDFEPTSPAVTADMIDGSRLNYRSVRSGIYNASPSTVGAAGGRDPRMIQINQNDLGYNFHGYGHRVGMNWKDVKAVVATQAMRCVPMYGTDMTDCNRKLYIANVGIDSFLWSNTGVDFGVSQQPVGFGRFKPVTTSWQLFTNYVGPSNFAGVGVPPIPSI